jgi:Isopeptidase T
VLNTKAILLALRSYTKKFDGNQQQDAQEFLLYLLAALNEEAKVVPDQYNGSSKIIFIMIIVRLRYTTRTDLISTRTFKYKRLTS